MFIGASDAGAGPLGGGPAPGEWPLCGRFAEDLGRRSHGAERIGAILAPATWKRIFRVSPVDISHEGVPFRFVLPASATGLGWDCSAGWRRLGGFVPHLHPPARPRSPAPVICDRGSSRRMISSSQTTPPAPQLNSPP